jgi:hypothetical protein
MRGGFVKLCSQELRNLKAYSSSYVIRISEWEGFEYMQQLRRNICRKENFV